MRLLDDYYTPMVGGGDVDLSLTYNVDGVSAPNISVTSPVDSSTMTASELAGNGVDYSSSVSMNFDKFFSEQTDRIAGETQIFLNGLKSPDVQLTFGGKDDGDVQHRERVDARPDDGAHQHGQQVLALDRHPSAVLAASSRSSPW